jgi:hypothetical protein
MVSTLKFKQQTQIDLEKSMDGVLQSMKCTQNMIVKQEEFETRGCQGLAYGTFTNKCNY